MCSSDLGGGMPTRITIPEAKLDDVIARINDAPLPVPRPAGEAGRSPDRADA